MNKVELIGRLTKDPELRYTSSNIAVASFTLAVNRPFQDQDGEKQADYINIFTWRKLAENTAKYCSKGRLIAVEGSIRTRTYEKDNQKHFVTEVEATNIEFLELKKDDNKQNASQQANSTQDTKNSENESKTDPEEDIFANFGDSLEIDVEPY